MRVSVSKDGKKFIDPLVKETPEKYEDGFKQFTQMVDEILDGERPIAMAGGIAGPVSEYKEYIVRGPNLPNWIDKPFKRDLEKYYNVPAVLQNDSALVALGEAIYGAAIGYNIVSYMTVSTGVGGARIVNGEIDITSVGFEPGHQIIDMDKSFLDDETSFKLQDLVSGNSVLKRMGKKPVEIKDESFWNEMARILAFGVYNSILHWSPEVFVLGGSMIVGNPAISVEKVEQNLKEILTIFPEPPRIKEASLGDYGGLYGGLALLRNYNIIS